MGILNYERRSAIMKKRCTNSACRKMFIPGPVCPFCGKIYPRIENKGAGKYNIFLKGYSCNYIRVILIIRGFDKSQPLKELKRMIQECPGIVSRGLSAKEAAYLCEKLKNAGAFVELQREGR